MSIRLPAWAKTTLESFNPDYDNWFNEVFLVHLAKRNNCESKGRNSARLTPTSLANIIGHLRRHLMRMYGDKLLTKEFNDWIVSCQQSSNFLSEYDKNLLHMIVTTQLPQEIVKIQNEVRGKIKKNPTIESVVSRQFVKINILKTSILNIFDYSKRKRKLNPRKKKKEKDQEDNQTSLPEPTTCK